MLYYIMLYCINIIQYLVQKCHLLYNFEKKLLLTKEKINLTTMHMMFLNNYITQNRKKKLIVLLSLEL